MPTTFDPEIRMTLHGKGEKKRTGMRHASVYSDS